LQWAEASCSENVMAGILVYVDEVYDREKHRTRRSAVRKNVLEGKVQELVASV